MEAQARSLACDVQVQRCEALEPQTQQPIQEYSEMVSEPEIEYDANNNVMRLYLPKPVGNYQTSPCLGIDFVMDVPDGSAPKTG